MGNAEVTFVEIAIAIIAFAGISLIAFALFGRPTHAAPCCAGCGADARPRAWSEHPTCACGKRLDRAGAVYSRGRQRRRGVAYVGAAVWLLAAAIAGEAIRLRSEGTSWIVWVPDRILVARAEAGDEWALEHFRSDQASPTLAALALRRFYAGATFSGVSVERLYALWARSFPDRERVGGDLAKATLLSASVVGNEAHCFLATRDLPHRHDWLVRIERVERQGQSLPWSLEVSRPPTWANAGERVFVGAGVLRVSLPPDDVSTSPLSVTLTLVRTEAAVGLALRPALNAPTAPSDWRGTEEVFTATVECTPERAPEPQEVAPR